MWNRQSKSQSTVKEKPDEVQEIQNINARDNVAEPDAFEGKELTKKEQKKLEEKLAEAVASTGQDEQNKQDTASKETNTQSEEIQQTEVEQPSEEENQSETDKPSDNNDEQQTEPEEPAEQLPIVKEPGWVTGIY